MDNYVLTANIDNVTLLDLRDKGISDLTGIEDFTQLALLLCSNNNLTSLDVSNNRALLSLQVNDNNLTSLSLGDNPVLTYLDCANNNLNTLDLSNNYALEYLYCIINNIPSLDLSNNVALEYLYIGSNNLTSLNVSNNPALKLLYCGFNSLTRLSLVNNPFLESINCSNNELVGLNLKNGKNTGVTYFTSFGNPDLECIQVDDSAYSEANWNNIDASSRVNSNCHYKVNYSREILINLENDTFKNKEFSIYPNPVNDVVTISIQNDTYYSIVNINGQQLVNGKLKAGNNRLNVSQLKAGLYILNIQKNGISINKKFIQN